MVIIYVNAYNQCFKLVKEASDLISTNKKKYKNFKDFLPSGNVELAANFRSVYDSSHIVVDDQFFTTIMTSATDTLITLPVEADGQIAAMIRSYKDGVEYKSGTKSISVFVTTPQTSYVNLVTDTEASSDFLGSDFIAEVAENFSDFAFHSAHPYPQATDLVYQLKIPIVIAEENAILEYSLSRDWMTIK